MTFPKNTDRRPNNRLAYWLRVCRLAKQNRTYDRSFRVAIVVGSLLNLINQPETMLSIITLDFNSIHPTNAVKALLTYTVPFLVATYGAMTALSSQMQPADDIPSRCEGDE